MYKITTALGALATGLCIASAASASTHTFNFSGLNGIGSSYTTSVGGIGLTVTAGSFISGYSGGSPYRLYDDDGDRVWGSTVLGSNSYDTAARLTADSPDGLGVRNSGGDGSDTTDGSGWDDYIILTFDQDVQLESARFGNFNGGYPGYDDFRLVYDVTGDDNIGAGDFVTTDQDDNPFSAFPSIEGNVYAFLATGSNDDWRLRNLTVSTVPLPAGSLMLLTGLAGFAAMRRRKKS